MKKEDYTKAALLKALIELLQTKSLEDITIVELITKAGIGRASFYRNYAHKEDILNEHLQHLFIKCHTEFIESGGTDINNAFLLHFWKEKEFYLTLYQANLGYKIYDAMKNMLHIKEQENPIQAYFLSWYAGSIYGFIEEWMSRGMKETPKELLILMSNFSNQQNK